MTCAPGNECECAALTLPSNDDDAYLLELSDRV